MRLPNLEFVEWVLLKRKKLPNLKTHLGYWKSKRDGNNKNKMEESCRRCIIIIKDTREALVIWRISEIN